MASTLLDRIAVLSNVDLPYSLLVCDYDKIICPDSKPSLSMQSIMKYIGFHSSICETHNIKNGLYVHIGLVWDMQQLQIAIYTLVKVLKLDSIDTPFLWSFNIPENLNKFSEKVRFLMSSAAAPPPRIARNDAPATPVTMNSALEYIQTVDISSIIREQPIYKITDTTIDVEIYAELYVSLQDVKKKLGINPKNYHDFNVLTSILDFRMLRHIVQDRLNKVSTKNRLYAINLNISSVISDRFDDIVALHDMQSIFVELSYEDVIQSDELFSKAVAKLISYGMRVVVEHVPICVFPYLFFPCNNVSFIKIKWDESFAQMPDLGIVVHLPSADTHPPLIFCQCGNKTALQTARIHGIRFCQGYYITEKVSGIVDKGFNIATSIEQGIEDKSMDANTIEEKYIYSKLMQRKLTGDNLRLKKELHQLKNQLKNLQSTKGIRKWLINILILDSNWLK